MHYRFARKITAQYERDKGYIEFGDGKCELTATSRLLAIQIFDSLPIKCV